MKKQLIESASSVTKIKRLLNELKFSNAYRFNSLVHNKMLEIDKELALLAHSLSLIGKRYVKQQQQKQKNLQRK